MDIDATVQKALTPIVRFNNLNQEVEIKHDTGRDYLDPKYKITLKRHFAEAHCEVEICLEPRSLKLWSRSLAGQVFEELRNMKDVSRNLTVRTYPPRRGWRDSSSHIVNSHCEMSNQMIAEPQSWEYLGTLFVTVTYIIEVPVNNSNSDLIMSGIVNLCP